MKYVYQVCVAHIHLICSVALRWSLVEAMQYRCLDLESARHLFDEVICDKDNGVPLPLHVSSQWSAIALSALHKIQSRSPLRCYARKSLCAQVLPIYSKQTISLNDNLALL